MAIVLTILLILGLSAFLYFKGTIVRSFAVVVTAIFASIAAFAYFEPVANTFISRGTMGPWAASFSFLLLFIITFAILFTLTLLLTRSPVNFGPLPERIGRIVCGIISGFILSGAIITALTMAPLSETSPYQRFNQINPNADKPSKSLFNADGFITGLFSFESNGSLSGQRSFSVLHPDFLNQVFLNRLKTGISPATSSEAIAIPAKAAIWAAPENLKDAAGKLLTPKSGCKLMIARIGIKQSASRDASDFAFSQLRLVCKEKSQAREPLAGKGVNIYPIGYLKATDQVQTKNLTDQMKLEPADFDTAVKWLDFVFAVPENLVPVLAEFKQNNVAQLPATVTAEQVPLPEPFIPRSKCIADIAQLQTPQSAPIYGIELAADEKFLEGLTIKIGDVNQWQSSQTENSIKPAQFEEGRIIQTRAQLLVKEPNQPKQEEPQAAPTPAPTPKQAKGKAKPKRALVKYTPRGKKAQALGTFVNMLRPLAGYKLISLKCNTPAVGAAIKGEQLPVLMELSGLVDYPVGVIAAGKVDDQTIYEVDYCSVPMTADSNSTIGCLTIAQNGTVEKPFPDNIWLTEKAQSISNFYTLYLVKTGTNLIITAVKPAGDALPAKFEKYEGFIVK